MKNLFVLSVLSATLIGCNELPNTRTRPSIPKIEPTAKEVVVKKVVEPPADFALKCDGSMGFYMGPTPGHQHGVLSVDYIGDDEYWDKTPVENFTIRPVWPDSEGNCRVSKWDEESKKWELSGPALMASILDNVLEGTRPNGIARQDESLVVTCHAELSYNDCRIDRVDSEVESTVKSQSSTKDDKKVGKVDDDQTKAIAKAAVIQSSIAIQAANKAQKTADESLAVANDNKGLLTMIAESFGLTIEGKDLEKGDKPGS